VVLMVTVKRGSRLFSLLALSAVWLALGVAFAAPAGAGEAKGCTWSVKSLDRDGKVIDTASGPGSGATKDDPLSIDQQGNVQYQATTDQVIAHGSWNVETSGALSISFGGDVTNDSGTTDKIPTTPAHAAALSGFCSRKVTSFSGSQLAVSSDPPYNPAVAPLTTGIPAGAVVVGAAVVAGALTVLTSVPTGSVNA
jgi:hypothetical protein